MRGWISFNGNFFKNKSKMFILKFQKTIWGVTYFMVGLVFCLTFRDKSQKEVTDLEAKESKCLSEREAATR